MRSRIRVGNIHKGVGRVYCEAVAIREWGKSIGTPITFHTFRVLVPNKYDFSTWGCSPTHN